MTKLNVAHFLLILAALAVAPHPVVADSWAPPKTQVTLASKGQYRVTVVPRPISGQLDYFRDKVKGAEPAGQPKQAAQKSPIARVERFVSAGKWQMVWQKPLVNDVAPPSVLLANDGLFLVTFDNWHSAGFGDDVVVIYDRYGNLVRKLSLEQILPAAYVAHLPRSVSSRWWSGTHRLVDDDRLVELQVVEPGAELHDNPSYVPVRIRLVDGEVIPPSGPAWARAMVKAKALEAKRQSAWDEARRVRARPLSAPTTTDTMAWRSYMFELRDRIARDEEMMGGMVLAAPGEEPGFHRAESISRWVQNYDNQPWDKSFIFCSPTSDKLAATLEKPLRARAPGSMRGARIVFVGTPEQGKALIEAASKAGAEIIVVDSTKEFPPGKPLPIAPPPLWEPAEF